ncbi:MAG: sensor histidine kinase [Phycisphaerae bacterium]
MAIPPASRANRLLQWRIAGTWLVLLAVALATAAITLALVQASHLSMRLIAAVQPRADEIAADVQRRFERRTERALDLAAGFLHVQNEDSEWTPPRNWPIWLDGLYAWDGGQLRTLQDAPESAQSVAEVLIARLAMRPIVNPTELPTAGMDVFSERVGDANQVFAYIQEATRPGRSLTVIAHIDPLKLRKELLDPMLTPRDGLAVVPSGQASAAWSRPLGRALKGWAIQPTETFSREQGRALLAQTGAYVALTLLSLGILLVSLWMLTRLAKHETALAEIKTSFIAGVSHELKTPLAMIRMFVETLESGRVPTEEKRAEYLRVIARESERLAFMIDNLLDFSRIEAGKQEYTFETLDMGKIVSETYEAYRLQLDHKGFEHHLHIASDLPEIRADRHALAQALINLIGNAIKYSEDEKYLAIEVVSDTRRDRRGALLSVHDHGIGIAPEDRRHLFEGFYRAEDHRVRQRGGTGLGLAVLKHFVDAHGGSIEVESRLVKGTTFRIFLPEGERHSAGPAPTESS